MKHSEYLNLLDEVKKENTRLKELNREMVEVLSVIRDDYDKTKSIKFDCDEVRDLIGIVLAKAEGEGV